MSAVQSRPRPPQLKIECLGGTFFEPMTRTKDFHTCLWIKPKQVFLLQGLYILHIITTKYKRRSAYETKTIISDSIHFYVFSWM